MIADRQMAMREAIDWHIRLERADASVWRDFIAWLEADEAHATAYDNVALDDSLLTRPLIADNDEAPFVPERRTGRFWAVAASVALAFTLAGTAFLTRHSDAASTRYAVETGGDAPRAIRLADGSRIDLNRNTKLVLDRADPRFAMLDHGQAYFSIKHDPKAPFRVEAGDAKLEDVGTAFDVIHENGRLDVAVSQGGVIFQPAREAISLKPGMTLAVRADGPAVVGRADIASIGEWQHDRIEFRGALLADVVQDAGRMTGATIGVDKAIAQQRFWGTLRSDRGTADLLANLAALTGNKADRNGAGWLLTADGGGAR